MGMYDTVRFKAPCKKCGTEIATPEWQSKDAECELDTIYPQQVNRFYAACPNQECKEWNESKVVDAEAMKVELTDESL